MVFGGALPVYLMNIIHFVNLCNIVMKCCQGGMCFRGLFWGTLQLVRLLFVPLYSMLVKVRGQVALQEAGYIIKITQGKDQTAICTA